MDIRQAIIAEIPQLRRFACALARDPVAADDLVQDCLERALGRLHLYREKTNIRAWLFTILRNLYRNQRRGIARRPSEIPFDEQQQTLGGTAPNQGQGLAIHDLGQALSSLPDLQREVILLIGLEGMSYKETAKILGAPVGTVMSRLSRGRETLRCLTDGESRRGNVTLRRVK
ncbi:MAG: RNA polymerase sigma factor [Alphaproteobacteria bacterium]